MTTFARGDTVLVREKVASVSPAVRGQTGTVTKVTGHAVEVRFDRLRGPEGEAPTLRFLPDELKRIRQRGRETPSAQGTSSQDSDEPVQEDETR